MMAQVGGFALPALLPTYMLRWNLTATEAGWLIGIFFAAYVAAVPLLLAMTDRVPVKRVYLLGTGLTAVSHLGFALVADGFWLGVMLRALAGVGWAGTYMTGLKALADRLEGVAQSLQLGKLRLSKVYAAHHPDNRASRRILENSDSTWFRTSSMNQRA